MSSEYKQKEEKFRIEISQLQKQLFEVGKEAEVGKVRNEHLHLDKGKAEAELKECQSRLAEAQKTIGELEEKYEQSVRNNS